MSHITIQIDEEKSRRRKPSEVWIEIIIEATEERDKLEFWHRKLNSHALCISLFESKQKGTKSVDCYTFMIILLRSRKIYRPPRSWKTLQLFC